MSRLCSQALHRIFNAGGDYRRGLQDLFITPWTERDIRYYQVCESSVMSFQENQKDYISLALIIASILIPLFGIPITAMLEAKAFNRCTGGNVSWTEAIFISLRVENCLK